MKRSISALAVTTAAAASVLVPTHATSAPHTVLYDCAGERQIRPASIIVYCGDARVTVGSLQWRTWNRRSARGSGVEYRKVCVPNCADGGVTTRPVDVELYRASRGEFTRIALSGSGGAQSYRLTGHRG